LYSRTDGVYKIINIDVDRNIDVYIYRYIEGYIDISGWWEKQRICLRFYLDVNPCVLGGI
jgi:hypothetical protein